MIVDKVKNPSQKIVKPHFSTLKYLWVDSIATLKSILTTQVWIWQYSGPWFCYMDAKKKSTEIDYKEPLEGQYKPQ